MKKLYKNFKLKKFSPIALLTLFSLSSLSCGNDELDDLKNYNVGGGSVTSLSNSNQQDYYQPKAFTEDYQVEDLFITKNPGTKL